MKKFNELSYWLDLNEHIKLALELAGLALAVAGVINFLPPFVFSLGWIVLMLLVILVIMQLILGIVKMNKDAKSRKSYKRKYSEWIEKLKNKKKRK